MLPSFISVYTLFLIIIDKEKKIGDCLVICCWMLYWFLLVFTEKSCLQESQDPVTCIKV